MKRLSWARLGIVACGLAMVLAAAAGAEELSGKQIVDKIRLQESYADTMLKVEMTLVNDKGETRVRKLVNRIKKVGGLSRTVTTFLYPDDVKGTKFLTIENQGREDDQFLYLPALDRVRRIAATQKGDSFMGTDFSYGDLQTRDPEKGTHTKLREEQRDGFDCYVVQSVPDKNDADAQYAKTITWVRKDIFVPVYVEFYDKKTGELAKVLRASDFRQTDKIWMAHHSEMEDVRRKHKTVIDIKGVENNKGLPDDLFTERFLQDKTQL